MLKDLGIAMELAHRTRTPVPLSSLCYQLFEAAGNYLGPDCSNLEIVRWMESMAGTELRRDEVKDSEAV